MNAMPQTTGPDIDTEFYRMVSGLTRRGLIGGGLEIGRAHV